LRSLLTATQADPLSAICLFSSVAGRTGNAGQADYAMANEVLNRVAQAEAKRRPNCVVKSIGWGPWAGGMVTPNLKAKFDELMSLTTENEWAELKEAKNNYDFDNLGRYFSALSNEANLKGKLLG
ncbi:MAG: KR domain-containing protein, partial [Nostocales cyanobacterium W4_Combined_metabat2_030]|nr:KR domain-containing protein [Nostocales cyanobacterium W4_Combined_metabat2_030]